MIHLLSLPCYDDLNLIRYLLHPMNSVSQSFNIEDNLENKMHFLKMKCENLEAKTRFVVAQVDEIYVKGKINFKNGKQIVLHKIKLSQYL